MARFTLLVNGRPHGVEAAPDTPLLWVLRDALGLKGTKYGCGVALCGVCTVHLDGRAVRSCVTPVSSVGPARVVTIEGLSDAGDHPVQQAWTQERVPQCGYCQPGQIMQAAALLAENPSPSDLEIERGMEGNVCRCGTYPRIRRAVRRAAELTKRSTP